MNTVSNHLLLSAAAKVRLNAYAPYSGFRVGAAVLTDDGTVITGCNVENASYGLAICAERNAIGRAIAMGYARFDTIAVVSEPLATPCGACRQFIVEFGKEIRVICADANHLDEVREWTIAELIPESFDGSKLPRQ